MSRHTRICCGLSIPVTTPPVSTAGISTATFSRSRSSSADTRASSVSGRQVTSSALTDEAYSPTQLSTLLSSVILEAVPALLDQHGCYNQASLVEYMGKFYPEIPEQFRAPIVVATTAGARHSALMHMVWEKNINSPDAGKRQFAAGAASSLSFWALGMLPVHRSGNVYEPREAQSSAVTAAAPQTLESTDVLAVTVSESATAEPGLGTKDGATKVLQDVTLPVSLGAPDKEFEELLAAESSSVQPVLRDLFPEVCSVGSVDYPRQQSTDVPTTRTTDVMQREVVVAEVQQMDDQQPEVGCTQPAQQQSSEVRESIKPTGTTPVLSIHAVSDIESDVGVSDGRKAGSTATANIIRHTSNASSSRGERKRDSPRRRPESPRRKQSRSSNFTRHQPATYSIDAEEYRQFQNYMRYSRGFRFRK